MGRRRHIDIEDSKNERIAMLIQKYVGDETYGNVAIAVGMDPSTLSYICRGKVMPTLDTLSKLGKQPRNGVDFLQMIEAAR